MVADVQRRNQYVVDMNSPVGIEEPFSVITEWTDSGVFSGIGSSIFFSKANSERAVTWRDDMVKKRGLNGTINRFDALNTV